MNPETSMPNIIYMRCKSWRKWPSQRQIGGPLMNADLGGQKVRFGFQIATYQQGAEVQGEGEPSGPSTVVYKDKHPHLLSENMIVWDPGDSIEVAFDRVRPRCGEIDLRVNVYSEEPIDFEVLANVFTPFLHMLIAYFNYVFGDALVPVAPLQVIQPEPPGTVICTPLPRGAQTLRRSEYEEDSVKDALRALAVSCGSLSSTDLNTLHVAARRMFTAQREEDLVDRYCDLWEVCEFLSKDVKAKGGKVGRIAQVLSSYIGRPKARVENCLRLRELFSLRGAVIHEGVEDQEALERNIELLRAIASQLFRARMGLAYEGSSAIDRLLEEDSQGATTG